MYRKYLNFYHPPTVRFLVSPEDVKLVTAPHPACAGSCAREKFLSVERHLGVEWLERCLFRSNKGLEVFQSGSKKTYSLPETNSSHLKIDGWKMKFPFGM